MDDPVDQIISLDSDDSESDKNETVSHTIVIPECNDDDFSEFPEFNLTTASSFTKPKPQTSIAATSLVQMCNNQLPNNSVKTLQRKPVRNKKTKTPRAAKPNTRARTRVSRTNYNQFEIYDKPLEDDSNNFQIDSKESIILNGQFMLDIPSTSKRPTLSKNWTIEGDSIVIDSDEADGGTSELSEESDYEHDVDYKLLNKWKAECSPDDLDDEEPTPKLKRPSRNKNFKNLSKRRKLDIPRQDYNDDLNYEWGLGDLSCVMNDESLEPVGVEARERFFREKQLTNVAVEELHKSLVSCPKKGTKASHPKGLKVILMPHQQHALAWLLWREQQKPCGGLLADDMGLGKTIMMIALILATTEEKDLNKFDDESSEEEFDELATGPKHAKGGTLIVCPLSLLKQWEAEIKTHCKRGLLTVRIFHGQLRKIEAKHLAKFSVVLTTYHSLVKEYETKSTLFKINWRRVILDEAHYVRNPKSLACKGVCALTSERRWTLTGTPLHNKEKDLYAILKFLQCKPFDEMEVWSRWVNPKNKAGNKRLLLIMKTLMLRRTKLELQKKGYMPTLPNKYLEVIEIKLDEEEQIVYEKILEYTQSMFLLFMEQRAKTGIPIYGRVLTSMQRSILTSHLNNARIKMVEILVLYLRLRQVCCHPALVLNWLFQNEEEEEEEGVSQAPIRTFDDVDLVGDISPVDNPVFQEHRQSSKIRAVLQGIEKILNAESVDNIKIVVVSQWTSMLTVVANNLANMPGVTYASFTGKVAAEDRQEIVERFNDPSDELNVLLLSLTAGGVGLNLMGANHLFLIDNHWNPQLECQAEDRIYRYGQSKDVYIYRYICKMTIEEKVRELQKVKLEMAHNVLTGTRKVSSKLTIRDFKFLFGLESPNDANNPDLDEPVN